MKLKTKPKYGTYEHFCVLILAQDSWKDYDRESVMDISLEKRLEYRDHDYHFYHRLTRRTSEPENILCPICKYVYKILLKLTNNRDHIIYSGHHYIETEDYPHLIEFSKMLLHHEKVKKIFVLDLDRLKEFKVDEIANLSFDDLESLITLESCTIDEFEGILKEQKFERRTLYDIIKGSYY